jgi:hypothetical protein
MPKWRKNLKSMKYQYVAAKIILKNLLLNHQNWLYGQVRIGQIFTSYLVKPSYSKVGFGPDNADLKRKRGDSIMPRPTVVT